MKPRSPLSSSFWAGLSHLFHSTDFLWFCYVEGDSFFIGLSSGTTTTNTTVTTTTATANTYIFPFSVEVGIFNNNSSYVQTTIIMMKWLDKTLKYSVIQMMIILVSLSPKLQKESKINKLFSLKFDFSFTVIAIFCSRHDSLKICLCTDG